MVLLSTQFISKPGSINHGPLRFIFRVLGLLQSIINLSLKGVDHRLKSTLIMHGLGIDDSHLTDSSASISQFRIKLAFAAISNTNCLHNFLAATGLFFVARNGFPKLSLIPLDGLLSLSISLVGMIKSNLKFIDVRFKFLLYAKGLTLR